MALPPDPIEEVLPQAALIVVGVVRSVEDLAPWPEDDRGAAVDAAPDRPPQRVHVAVSRVLRGHADKEIVATKPAGSYALTPGVRGPFLIDDKDAVLGRYGPDTYALEEIERALITGAQR